MTPFHRKIYQAVLSDMDNWSNTQFYDYAVEMRKKELKEMSFFSLSEIQEKIELVKQL